MHKNTTSKRLLVTFSNNSHMHVVQSQTTISLTLSFAQNLLWILIYMFEKCIIQIVNEIKLVMMKSLIHPWQ